MHEIRRILAETLGVEENQLGDNAGMDTVQEWDSAAHINVVLSIEQQYNVQLKPEEVLTMTSLPEICRVLRDRGVAV